MGVDFLKLPKISIKKLLHNFFTVKWKYRIYIWSLLDLPQ
jgi:hypothetical protein